MNKKKRTRLLFDMSYTIASEKISGVERVVRNLRLNLPAICEELSLEFVPVISSRGRFYKVMPETLSAFDSFLNWKKDPWRDAPWAFSLFCKGICRTIPHRKVLRALQPQYGHLGLFRFPSELWERMLRYRVAKKQLLLSPTDNDLLLMPDAYWTEMQALHAASRARDCRALVVALIYDLIPLTHPQFVGESRSRDFLAYFRAVMKSASAVAAISQSVAGDIKNGVNRFLEPAFPGESDSYCSDIFSFRLGGDFLEKRESEPDAYSSHEVLKPLFACEDGAPFFLMVSMFDPRKNHEYILDAFDAAWSQGARSKLCLIGRKGWNCNSVLKRIESHPERNRKLFAVHDASDTDVKYAYRKADVSVLPSITEGFGLPIVESLQSGTVTWASDIPIHREVGGDVCSYFDLGDHHNLAKKIVEFESRFKRTEKSVLLSVSSPQLASWRMSASELLYHSLQL